MASAFSDCSSNFCDCSEFGDWSISGEGDLNSWIKDWSAFGDCSSNFGDCSDLGGWSSSDRSDFNGFITLA